MPGVVDHQVAVDRGAFDGVHERGDVLEHDRAHGDRLDEMAVAHVEVEDARAGAEQDVDLLAERCEVRRVERRFDFDRPDPVSPGHAAPGD